MEFEFNLVETFSYIEVIKKQLLVFCKLNEVMLLDCKFTKENGRDVISAYIEGRIGHINLCPKAITPTHKALLENNLDIDFPDGTRAIADLQLVNSGKLFWLWKIKWERESTYADW